jgi:hypothetical protein
MKQVYKYDEEGFFVEPVLIENNEVLPVNCTESELPQPNYKPKFNGVEWVETLTQEQIDEIKNQPQPPSELDGLKQQNAELKQQMEQQNTDMQAFMDYILGQIGGN